MLDTTTAIAAFQPWTETLDRGDVVVFSFPCSDEGPVKPRPCLVLEVGRAGDNGFVELAYGTTSKTAANRGYEIHVSREAAMRAAGLSKPTRFVAARRVIASFGSALFLTNASHPTPVIGRLDPDTMERMNAVRARLWAEKDFAAERRRERRGRTEKGVPVVWRCSGPAGRPASEAGR
jgi:hypothetical protein